MLLLGGAVNNTRLKRRKERRQKRAKKQWSFFKSEYKKKKKKNDCTHEKKFFIPTHMSKYTKMAVRIKNASTLNGSLYEKNDSKKVEVLVKKMTVQFFGRMNCF